jgi:hypothetical protein
LVAHNPIASSDEQGTDSYVLVVRHKTFPPEMDKLDCARLEAIAERLRAAMAEFLRLLLARDNSSHTASENCFHRCFHNETKQQIMSRKKKGEKPAETDFSPLLD